MEKATTRRLYIDIRRDFNELRNKKDFGVQKYTLAWVLAKLAEKYYKSPSTIENIVFRRNSFKR